MPGDSPRDELPPPAEPVHPVTDPAAREPDLPPLEPFHQPSPAERPLPRGCHPLVFGVVLATLQFAATCYFMPSCFHPPG